MQGIVNLYSNFNGEIEKFLEKFFQNKNFAVENNKWQKNYENPVEMTDIITAFIENIDKYKISMWISIDAGVFIKVTLDNYDELVRYLFERFPY